MSNEKSFGILKIVLDICRTGRYNTHVAERCGLMERKVSSAGRAPALQAGGHRFEPCRSHQGEKPEEAGVAELADAQDLKSCGSNIVPVRFRSPA